MNLYDLKLKEWKKKSTKYLFCRSLLCSIESKYTFQRVFWHIFSINACTITTQACVENSIKKEDDHYFTLQTHVGEFVALH